MMKKIRKNALVSAKPYFTIRGMKGSEIKLYNKDCISGFEEIIKPESIDVVVTSPPYNIGVKYSRHSDNLPRSEYLDWMKEFGKIVKRSLKEDGSFFLNVGNTPKDQWLAWDVAQTMRESFVLQNVIQWIKSIAIEKKDVGRYPNIVGDISVGHYKPIVSNRFLNDCQEYLFHFTKSGNVNLQKISIGVPYQDKSNIGRWKSATRDLRDRGNTWFIPYETIRDRGERPHPATFPTKLPEMCIKLHGLKRKMLVMDPFLGIGSSAIAALKLGTNFIGFDIDIAYLHTCSKRLESFSI